jgi:hypothetical protein
MNKLQSDQTQSGILDSLVQYLAWFLTSAGAILDALFIRGALVAVLAFFQVISADAYHKRGGVGVDLQFGYTMTAIDLWMIVILGCVTVGVVIAIEYYLRKGRAQGALYKRIAIVVGIEALILIVMARAQDIFTIA